MVLHGEDKKQKLIKIIACKLISKNLFNKPVTFK